MKKIAFLIDTIAMDTAGTQKQLLETIRRLDKNEFHSHLVCLYESAWMRRNSLPCPCTCLGYEGFLDASFPSVVRKLSKLIDDEQFDILQTFFEDSIYVGFLSSIFSKSQPRLLSNRRDMGLGPENEPWYHSVFRFVRPAVHRRFDAIVANCAAVAEHVSKIDRIPRDRIKVLYNGVDIPRRADVMSIPEPFSLHPDAFWIGIVASLTPVKRHDLLLQSMRILVSEEPRLNARLLILGDGPLEQKLRTYSQTLGLLNQVDFLGATHDVDAYLRNLDVGVLCSDREGLSNAILEYMANSIPVIATDTGGARELLAGGAGELVPCGDANALSSALLRLARNDSLRRRLGEAGRSDVQQRFSWSQSINSQQTFYRELLS